MLAFFGASLFILITKMPNLKNIQTVQNLKEKISKAKSVIFTEYHGLSANQINELRSKIRESGAEVKVAKNSLIKIALEEEKVKETVFEGSLNGPTAVIFSYEDVLAPIKIIADFAKKIELPKIKAGIIEGIFTSAEKIEELSRLPSKDELLAKTVIGLKSPITGFVNIMGGVQRKLIYTLSAIAGERKKEVS